MPIIFHQSLDRPSPHDDVSLDRPPPSEGSPFEWMWDDRGFLNLMPEYCPLRMFWPEWMQLLAVRFGDVSIVAPDGKEIHGRFDGHTLFVNESK